MSKIKRVFERAFLHLITLPCGEITVDVGPGNRPAEINGRGRIIAFDNLARSQKIPIRMFEYLARQVIQEFKNAG